MLVEGRAPTSGTLVEASEETVIGQTPAHLADIERGFRVLKYDIEIAPVHHRLPDRIRAHAMICFLALVLYRVMRMRLKAKGHSASPRTALDLLERIQRHTSKIGERTLNGLSTITPEQLELFDTLDIPKPAGSLLGSHTMADPAIIISIT